MGVGRLFINSTYPQIISSYLLISFQTDDTQNLMRKEHSEIQAGPKARHRHK